MTTETVTTTKKQSFHSAITFMLGFAIIGAVIMTIVTPSMVSILFTPPVSFGTNCEPAAAWSMSKLIASQIFGVVLGVVAGLVMQIWLARRKQRRTNV
jgi:hypothetical protein